MKKPIRSVYFVIALLGLICMCAFGIEAITPRSTAGVSVVDNNTARLPESEIFVLTHQVGKTRYVWEITYNGEAVKFNCHGCPDLDTTTLCGVDCQVEIDSGLLTGNFTLWEHADGTVYIEWPAGWHYRPSHWS
jgi:hypothetical protein